MVYSAKAIANLLIDVAKRHDSSVDQMKLQKLVYICHGWHLATTGEPLFQDDIEAWQYGPVIPALYDEFKNCGRNTITDYATEVQVIEDDLSVEFVAPKVEESDAHTHQLANKIWSIYGQYSGPQLSNLTHMAGTPWDNIFNNTQRVKIPNALIRSHFVELAKS